jgi:sec-independent protein translocase protein TatC
VLIFVLAAILTPPDIVSQILLAAPLLLLYGVSIGVAYLAAKKSE